MFFLTVYILSKNTKLFVIFVLGKKAWKVLEFDV